MGCTPMVALMVCQEEKYALDIRILLYEDLEQASTQYFRCHCMTVVSVRRCCTNLRKISWNDLQLYECFLGQEECLGFWTYVSHNSCLNRLPDCDIPERRNLMAPSMLIGAVFAAFITWRTGMRFSILKPLRKNSSLDHKQDCAPESATTSTGFYHNFWRYDPEFTVVVIMSIYSKV